jgi:membrane associated rhomboid family serine protease
MRRDYSYLTFPVKVLAVIWIAFAVDVILINIPFAQFGLLPRTTKGLIGIVTCPFIHAGLFHIISNSVSLFILLTITTIFFKKDTFTVVAYIIVIGGALVWIFGRSSYHVGTSGLIYGLAGFLIAFGAYKRKIVPIAISIFVVFTYGASLFIGLLPVFPGVSWEGHLFGAVAGVITARIASK